MEIIPFFIDQLERESALSSKVLAEVPEGKNDWKPHEKSMPLGYLAAMVAQMPAWVAMILATDGLDLADKKTAGQFQTGGSDSREALLTLAQQSSEKGKQALQGTSEKLLHGTWSFRMGDKVLGSGTRMRQIADTFTHLAHHRGQLTVYLRLLGEKVPATYGPSADEGMG